MTQDATGYLDWGDIERAALSNSWAIRRLPDDRRLSLPTVPRDDAPRTWVSGSFWKVDVGASTATIWRDPPRQAVNADFRTAGGNVQSRGRSKTPRGRPGLGQSRSAVPLDGSYQRPSPPVMIPPSHPPPNPCPAPSSAKARPPPEFDNQPSFDSQCETNPQGAKTFHGQTVIQLLKPSRKPLRRRA